MSRVLVRSWVLNAQAMCVNVACEFWILMKCCLPQHNKVCAVLHLISGELLFSHDEMGIGWAFQCMMWFPGSKVNGAAGHVACVHIATWHAC